MQNATLLNNPPKEQGVPVTLTAVDPNNNTVTIGTTTTDSAGNYVLRLDSSNDRRSTDHSSLRGKRLILAFNAETSTVVNAAPTDITAHGNNNSSGVSATEFIHYRLQHNRSDNHSRRCTRSIDAQKTTINKQSNKTIFPFFFFCQIN